MNSPHRFHIPVMGTGFTMDSPLRVGRYGIDSVVSLGDDTLMEALRRHYSLKAGLVFEAIGDEQHDARAKRVTAYLNFLDSQLREQSLALRASDFGPGSELTKYYAMLPPSPLKVAWDAMRRMPEDKPKWLAAGELRRLAVPGAIDVNVMTKVDRWTLPSGELLDPKSTDALTGLRGYAQSRLQSSVIFSAGMNPRLYGLLTEFDDFFPDSFGEIKKKVCLKVSDLRSAEVQGRFLAKKGIWCSEFRFESGLNCGGHAFAAQGQLLGPILAQYRQRADSLKDELYGLWAKALKEKRGQAPTQAPKIRLSVQGGVGTAAEQRMLQELYGADSVGWGTPFLLVPEATVVDTQHRQKLCQAGEGDVQLSDSSPLGVPFWSLKTSSSEAQRLERISQDKPGSPCQHSYLTFNTEFGPKPICTSSRSYQRQKLAALDASGLRGAALEESRQIVMERACICVDLGGSVLKECGQPDAKVAVCPGPNIAWFKREASLQEMLDHIYGRTSLFDADTQTRRPHMFLAELKLNLDFLKREWHRQQLGLLAKAADYFEEYRENLLAGVDYYLSQSEKIFGLKPAAFETELHPFRELLATMKF